MTRREFLASVPAAASLASAAASENITGDLTLWYRQPAAQWTDSLPIGNGRLGATVFGGIETERLQLNEDTFWSGHPHEWNNPDAANHLAEVRKAVAEERYNDADAIGRKMQGPYNESYQPIGILELHISGATGAANYRRELDLDSAIARVSYEASGVKYTREVFASAPDGVLAIRFTADQPGEITVTASLSSEVHSEATSISPDALLLTGKAPAHVAPNYVRSQNPIVYDDAEGKGMRFACFVKAIAEGGAVSATGNKLTVERADAITLLLDARTGYKGYASMPDLRAAEIETRCRKSVEAASVKKFEQLRNSHVRDHQSLFRRVALHLPANSSAAALPTDERLKHFAQDPSDQGLMALYFQYGRYQLIASSRPGTQPANLQGIWNNEMRPPWSSNWTSNINVQMNYWLAETCNLSECHSPLFDMLADAAVNGRETARVNYKAPGWVSHHNIDLWRQTAPVGDFGNGDPTWANWQMSGPWMCAHLWEHYLFTRDKAFLREKAYPVMKGSAEFCLGWLYEDSQGKLATCPSYSTENHFRAPNGKSASTSASCTMDVALIRELFANCAEAAAILGGDSAFRAKLLATRTKLRPYKIGRFGQLQEWEKDFEEPEPEQRHMSHLYPLYPGSEFRPDSNAEFWKASRVSLERRLAAGGAYTGWSRAWAICLWARLQDGDQAHESVRQLLNHSTGPNLWDTHPAGKGSIFQIDGNFGAPAGIAEMLLQSHGTAIEFLPALPKAWSNGSVSGLKARGNVAVDLAWSGGRLQRATLHPALDGKFRLNVKKHGQIAAVTEEGKAIRRQPDGSGTFTLLMRAGKVYELRFT